ncbi:PAS-domain containing protein [Oceanibium sediminis]|uniref:PAS-domain containing protein n=1 Tax=Oceanibium sediminis TaxID=2026339 RepID=UPI000DD41DE2|nr:PAS-domain containing protein [Oceanibium sediminis]
MEFGTGALQAVHDPPPGAPGVAPGQTPETVAGFLAPRDKAFRDHLAALVSDGTAFVHHGLDDGARAWCFTGKVLGLTPVLRVRPATQAEGALLQRLDAALHLKTETRRAAARAESAPLAVLESDAAGRVTWMNAAARRLFGPIALRSDLPAASPLPQTHHAAKADQTVWLRISDTDSPAAPFRLTYAEVMDSTVRAEQALEGFMATLAETFAHLESALAVFDHDRQLSLFNPALSDLFGLDAATLALRPSFREFLDALRRNRMIPEPQDFPAWRARLIEAATAQSPATFQEDWSLPSGQILRVTARPHPRGAIAFVFDDISQTVTLERRFRAELEQGQAILDHLGEGVAVFDSSGRLVFGNPALDRLLETPGFDGTLAELVAVGASVLGGAEQWSAFRSFALAADRAKTWDAVLPGGDGPPLILRGTALPDGSTLLSILVRGAQAHPWAEASRMPDMRVG